MVSSYLTFRSCQDERCWTHRYPAGAASATKAKATNPLFTANEGEPEELIDSVNTRGFKGLVTKKRASNYEPGLRFGACQKMLVNLHHSGARPEMGRNFLPARMVSRHRIRSSSR